MKRLALLPLLALAAALPALAAAPTPAPGGYAELADPRPAQLPSWRTLQASGWDRGGGFYDSGNFLREEPGRQFVMLDTEGPGVIDRMWFTRKSTKEPYRLQLFKDGKQQPSVDVDLDDLGTGKTDSFPAPFAGQVDLARWSYAPIPFRKRCKVVLVQTGSPEVYTTRENSAGRKIPHVYYQLTYRRLAKGDKVAERSSASERERAVQAWKSAAPAHAPVLAPNQSHAQIRLEPGANRFEHRLQGQGHLRQLRIQCPPGTPTDRLQLAITVDGAAQPSVLAPLGLFFAAPDPKVAVPGQWVGNTGTEYYCRLPVPFRKELLLTVSSTIPAPVELSCTLETDAQPVAADEGYLHVERYDHSSPELGRDYQVLSASGRGKWVGIVMDRPGNMEGDDRFYVDGETEPSLHGTGTEDFFNFAWGFAHLGGFPLHGITRHHGSPVLYRFHLPAGVPFQRSLRVDWEHGSGNTHQGRYSGLVYYYLDQP